MFFGVSSHKVSCEPGDNYAGLGRFLPVLGFSTGVGEVFDRLISWVFWFIVNLLSVSLSVDVSLGLRTSVFHLVCVGIWPKYYPRNTSVLSGHIMESKCEVFIRCVCLCLREECEICDGYGYERTFG